MMSRSKTFSRRGFDTSMPTTGLPGIGARMRTLWRAERHREVVGEGDDAVHLDPRRGLELEGGDDRAGPDGDHLAVDAEVGELRLQDARARDQRLLVDLHAGVDGRVEEREGRQLVLGRAGREVELLLLEGLRLLALARLGGSRLGSVHQDRGRRRRWERRTLLGGVALGTGLALAPLAGGRQGHDLVVIVARSVTLAPTPERAPECLARHRTAPAGGRETTDQGAPGHDHGGENEPGERDHDRPEPVEEPHEETRQEAADPAPGTGLAAGPAQEPEGGGDQQQLRRQHRAARRRERERAAAEYQDRDEHDAGRDQEGRDAEGLDEELGDRLADGTTGVAAASRREAEEAETQVAGARDREDRLDLTPKRPGCRPHLLPHPALGHPYRLPRHATPDRNRSRSATFRPVGASPQNTLG